MNIVTEKTLGITPCPVLAAAKTGAFRSRAVVKNNAYLSQSGINEKPVDLATGDINISQRSCSLADNPCAQADLKHEEIWSAPVPGHQEREIPEEVFLQRRAAISKLSEEELHTLEKVINEGVWPLNHCDENAYLTLQNLPTGIRKKLKVVITSFEGNRSIRNTNFHVALMGDTAEGLVIFHPLVGDANSLKASEWIDAFFLKDGVNQAALSQREAFNMCIPMFRFVEPDVYSEFHINTADGIYDLTRPTISLIIKKEIIDSCIWKDSFLINLHEAYQLFKSSKSYCTIMNCHQDERVSANARLTDDQRQDIAVWYPSSKTEAKPLETHSNSECQPVIQNNEPVSWLGAFLNLFSASIY